ncbi:MAG: isoprenylcysteine carboxylmethyltransferase family protein [Chitinivibrionales bacterium]|nr:isoprenylcysteine carboxylmethyltransferase family protein [Chitinivibrionales bacterium]
MIRTPSPTNPTGIDRQALRRKVLSRMILLLTIIMLVFFLPAGTFAYWQAWVYIGMLFIPATSAMIYFFYRDPELLERRMRMREKEKVQKKLMSWSLPFFVIAFLVPGFDHRFGWSSVPDVIVAISFVCICASYALFIIVLRTNRYASRIIEVAESQQVISTGPYGLVRHPMYLAALLLYLFTPLSLGSFWALIPFSFIIVVFVTRILDEEKMLAQNLAGYTEYMKKIRFRLVPGVW